MMQIKGKRPGWYSSYTWGSWHTGEVMNLPAGPVLEFIVDGHELQAMLAAFKAAGIVVNYPADALTPVF